MTALLSSFTPTTVKTCSARKEPAATIVETLSKRWQTVIARYNPSYKNCIVLALSSKSKPFFPYDFPKPLIFTTLAYLMTRKQPLY